MPLRPPHPLEYLFKGHKVSLQSWVYHPKHSTGNKAEFSRRKCGEASASAEGSCAAGMAVRWQQEGRESHTHGEKRGKAWEGTSGKAWHMGRDAVEGKRQAGKSLVSWNPSPEVHTEAELQGD